MRDTATILRNTAAASLAGCAVLTVVSVLLMPEFGGDFVDRLQAVADGGTASTVSALGFVLAQLPFAVGLVGVTHLLRDRAPVLSVLGATFAVLGGFGHAVYGGVNLTMLAMARDTANLDVHAEILAAGESGVGIPFMAMGLLGTVLGIILLAVGLWRAQVGPRWVPPVLIAFLLTEFIGAGLSAWAGYAAGLLYLVGLLALAVVVARTSPAAWATPTAVARERAAHAVVG